MSELTNKVNSTDALYSTDLINGSPEKHGDGSPSRLQHQKSKAEEAVSPMSASKARVKQFRDMNSADETEGDSSIVSDSNKHPKRGAWSTQEDEKLVHLVEITHPLKWVYIAQEMRTRTSKQCRERYHNYLKPSLTRTPIRREEGRKIEQLVAIHGKKWAEISRQLPGRSDNAIKNWWNASVNRRRTSQDQSMTAKHSGMPPLPSTYRSAQNSPYIGAHPEQSDPLYHKQYQQLKFHSPHQLSYSANEAPPQPSELDPPGSIHEPQSVQVTFSSMYNEPESRSQDSPSYGHSTSMYPNHSHTHHPMAPSHSGTLNQLTAYAHGDSKRSPEPRFSAISASSLSGSRSNSLADLMCVASPEDSPPCPVVGPQNPPQHVQASSSQINPSPHAYQHFQQPHNMLPSQSFAGYMEDPASLYTRLRQNSDLRRESTDILRADATSLSHYSLGNPSTSTPGSRKGSMQPNVSAELAVPYPPQSSRQSRLSIANLMNS